MLKTKNTLLHLLICPFFLFAISCGEKTTDTNSAPSEQSLSEAEKIVSDLESLSDLLLDTSEGRFVLQIAGIAQDELLAIYLQGSEFNLTKMLEWSDKVIAKIHTLNTPIVNDKIKEIEELRDAEIDPELIARYNEIIERMQSQQQVVQTDIAPLKSKVKQAISRLQSTEVWIEGDFARLILFEEARNTAYLTEASLAKLDLELDKIQD